MTASWDQHDVDGLGPTNELYDDCLYSDLSKATKLSLRRSGRGGGWADDERERAGRERLEEERAGRGRLEEERAGRERLPWSYAHAQWVYRFAGTQRACAHADMHCHMHACVGPFRKFKS